MAFVDLYGRPTVLLLVSQLHGAEVGLLKFLSLNAKLLRWLSLCS